MRVDGWEETAAPSPRGIRSSVINLVEKTHARTRTDATYRRGNASLPVCAQRILGSRDLGDPFRSLSLSLSLLSRSVRTSVLSARVQPWPEEEESRCKTRGGRGGDPPLPFPNYHRASRKSFSPISFFFFLLLPRLSTLLSLVGRPRLGSARLDRFLGKGRKQGNKGRTGGKFEERLR